MFYTLLLIAGLTLLIVGGDALVRGAVAIAVRLNIPHLIIGLTIVAFGTSAPELLVSVRAAFEGFAGLAVGNVVGSNIANIWLVLGAPALISAICCDQKYLTRNLVFMWLVSLVLLILCYYQPLTLWHGLVLVGLLALFLLESILRARSHRRDAAAALAGQPAEPERANETEEQDEVEELIEQAEKQADASLTRNVLILLAGLFGLALGAELTITGAVEIARKIGVSDATIGLTIVAIGTSLPELAATLMAAVRGQPGLALGNAIGSNIYNIAGVLGITALITPVAIAPEFLSFDLWVMLAAALTVVPFVLMKAKITRVFGLLFLVAYGLYIYKVMEIGRHSAGPQTQLTQSSQPA